ncbi:MAG: M24 family metallopeptidase, partial [Candidatus Uhrbacteria bacterium]
MSKSKTQSEIEIMREGGALLSRALEAAVKMVKPGVKTNELDAVAEAVIREGGGVPSFLHYRGSAVEPEFPCSLCASVNDEIVHGAASRGVELKEGDII